MKPYWKKLPKFLLAEILPHIILDARGYADIEACRAFIVAGDITIRNENIIDNYWRLVTEEDFKLLLNEEIRIRRRQLKQLQQLKRDEL